MNEDMDPSNFMVTFGTIPLSTIPVKSKACEKRKIRGGNGIAVVVIFNLWHLWIKLRRVHFRRGSTTHVYGYGSSCSSGT